MALDVDRILKSVRKLRKLLKTLPKRPRPDQIHDLRTQPRRLEAALDALTLNCRANERRVLRDLGRLRRRAGKVRDMDVFTAYTSTVHGDQDQDCVVQLLEYLGAERYRRAERLHARIRKYRSPLRRRLKRTARLLEKLVPGNGANPSDEQHTAPIDAMAANCKLLRELRAISDRKYESALALTDKPRKEYLGSSGRTSKRVSTTERRPPQPVLEATSAIAS